MSALLDLLKAKKQDLAAGKRRKTAKPTEGRTRWRILPSWRGDGQQFWHDFGQHFVKNAAKELKAVYICTEKTFGKPCEICDSLGHAIKGTTDDATMELLKDARSNGRVLLNALHLDGPTPGEVQILELPPSVFGSIIEIAQEWEEAGESILALGSAGKDIIISREGSGKNTKYVVQVAAKATNVPADVTSRLHNLDEYVQQESLEAQRRALEVVRNVGALPAPAASTAASLRAGGPSVMDETDDPYAVAEPPARRAAAPAAAATPPWTPPAEAFEDVPDLAAAPIAAPAKPAPVAAPAAASTGDDDLDAMLKSLAG